MNRKGDVWVSTVLYTLITIAVIALVLAAVTPVINKNKDKVIIEQSVDMLNQIDQAIDTSIQVEGTRAMVELSIKKGNLIFDSNQISWKFDDSNYMYSEPGQIVNKGKMIILTMPKDNKWSINITLNNLEINITSQLVLQPSDTSYKLFIENLGYNSTRNQTDLSITSSF